VRLNNRLAEPASDKPGFPPLLQRFWIALLAMTAVAAAYSLVLQRLLRTPGPYGLTSLSMFGVHCWDLAVFQERFLEFRKPGFWLEMNYPFTYPAPVGVIFGLLYKMPHPLKIYLATLVLALALWAWLVARALAARGLSHVRSLAFILTVLFTAWPVAVLLGMANIEGLLAIVIAGGVWAVLRQRWWLAATLIGLAGSIKFYPFVLLGLLLSRRRYKEFAWALVAAGLITLASVAILGPTVMQAQHHVDDGLLFVKQQLVLRLWLPGLQFNHSLFESVKWGVIALDRHLHPFAGPVITPMGMPRTPHEERVLEWTLRAYMIAVAALGVFLYFWKIRTLPMLNQLFALTICGVLLPPLSSDYTLVQLLVPLGLLCVYTAEQWQNGMVVAGLASCFVCSAFIFPVGTYFKFQYQMSSQVRTIALMALLAAVLRHPFRWRMMDHEDQADARRSVKIA